MDLPLKSKTRASWKRSVSMSKLRVKWCGAVVILSEDGQPLSLAWMTRLTSRPVWPWIQDSSLTKKRSFKTSTVLLFHSRWSCLRLFWNSTVQPSLELMLPNYITHLLETRSKDNQMPRTPVKLCKSPTLVTLMRLTWCSVNSLKDSLLIWLRLAKVVKLKEPTWNSMKCWLCCGCNTFTTLDFMTTLLRSPRQDLELSNSKAWSSLIISWTTVIQMAQFPSIWVATHNSKWAIWLFLKEMVITSLNNDFRHRNFIKHYLILKFKSQVSMKE